MSAKPIIHESGETRFMLPNFETIIFLFVAIKTLPSEIKAEMISVEVEFAKFE